MRSELFIPGQVLWVLAYYLEPSTQSETPWKIPHSLSPQEGQAHLPCRCGSVPRAVMILHWFILYTVIHKKAMEFPKCSYLVGGVKTKGELGHEFSHVANCLSFFREFLGNFVAVFLSSLFTRRQANYPHHDCYKFIARSFTGLPC